MRVGAADSPYESCAASVADADLKTGEARKQAFRRAAECVADGYCATYGIPPGACSAIAGPIAAEIANAAEAVGDAFANGFEIQGSAGPTLGERSGWSALTLNRAVNAVRDMHNALDPSAPWDLGDAKIYWLANTTEAATAAIYRNMTAPLVPSKYAPHPDPEGVSEREGARGMDHGFFMSDFSLRPAATVNEDVRAGLNEVTGKLVASAAEKKAALRVNTKPITLRKKKSGGGGGLIVAGLGLAALAFLAL